MATDDKGDKEAFLEIAEAKRVLAESIAQLRTLKTGSPPQPDEPPYCSFCGAGRNNVPSMVEGPGVFICGDCVAMCQSILDERSEQ